MRKYSLRVLIFIFSACRVFSQTAAPESDFQFWHETTVAFPILKKTNEKGEKADFVNFFLIGTFRAGENFSRPVDQRAGLGFDFIFNKHLSFTPSYVYRGGRPSGGNKEFEHRLRFDLNVGKSWKRFSVRNRNRVEYRIRNSAADSVRYRNRTQITFPIKKDKKEILAPFVYTEPYYDFSRHQWIRNEFGVGASRKINDNLTADFFYVQQNTRGNSLKVIRGLGMNLKFKID